MTNTIDFIAAQNRRHQDRLEAQDAHQGRLNSDAVLLGMALRVKFLGSLMEPMGKTIPEVQGHADDDLYVRQQPLVQCVEELMDDAPVIEQVMVVLRDSQCPHVKELRVRMADQLVKWRADDLAKISVGD